MNNFSSVIENTEKIVGLSRDEIREYTPEQLRNYLEEKSGKLFSFCSEFPTIGRSDVLRDNLIDGITLNKEIDSIIAKVK